MPPARYLAEKHLKRPRAALNQLDLNFALRPRDQPVSHYHEDGDQRSGLVWVAKSPVHPPEPLKKDFTHLTGDGMQAGLASAGEGSARRTPTDGNEIFTSSAW